MKHKLTDLTGDVRVYDSGIVSTSLSDALLKYEAEPGMRTADAFRTYLSAHGFREVAGGFAWDELTLLY